MPPNKPKTDQVPDTYATADDPGRPVVSTRRIASVPVGATSVEVSELEMIDGRRLVRLRLVAPGIAPVSVRLGPVVIRQLVNALAIASREVFGDEDEDDRPEVDAWEGRALRPARPDSYRARAIGAVYSAGTLTQLAILRLSDGLAVVRLRLVGADDVTRSARFGPRTLAHLAREIDAAGRAAFGARWRGR